MSERPRKGNDQRVVVPSHLSGVYLNGRELVFQTKYAGSIPVTLSQKQHTAKAVRSRSAAVAHFPQTLAREVRFLMPARSNILAQAVRSRSGDCRIHTKDSVVDGIWPRSAVG